MTGPRLRLTLAAFAAALITLALALPAIAAAATEYPLKVDITGSGEGGLGCKVNAGPPGACQAEYAEGTKVTVVAEPELGSKFVNWNGECDSVSGEECEVEMDAGKTIEVVFDLEEFELTVETDGSGEGVVECQVEGGPYELCPESETYPYETEVTLLAEPEEGSEFVQWSGDCWGVETECDLTVEEPLSVTATFEPRLFFVLNVEIEGSGEGVVECKVEGDPAEECEAEGEYVEDTVVTLYAKAKPGSEFLEWDGECDIAVGNECEVEMNEEKTVEAIFTANPVVSLTINLAGDGTGEVECGVNGGSLEPCEAGYPEGTELALVASAGTGSGFAGYSAGTGSAAGCVTSPCAFAITANSSVTATFNAIPSLLPTCATDPSLCPKDILLPTPEGKAKASPTAPVKGGKAALKLTCSGGPCKGTLKLTARVKQGMKKKTLVIGKASFSLAAGASKTIKVKLSGAAKKELGKGKALKAKVTGTGVVSSTVKLKLKK